MGVCVMADKEETKKALKAQKVAASRYISVPKRTIDYQVDTISVAGGAIAYFSPDRNTITENYVKGKDNSDNQSLAIKAHEQKHRDNNKAGLENMPMSLEQYYKVCCHNEISATMCELMQLRQEYIEAKSPKAREQIIKDNPTFEYYFKAIKEGKINPLANNAASFEKEMKFIATETQRLWMNIQAVEYDKNHTSMTEDFLDIRDYKELKPNAVNYAKARKIAYTIGGIDFSKYMQDIECVNPHMRDADKEIAANKDRKTVKKSIKKIYADEKNYVKSFKKIDFKPNPDLSVTQQYRLAMHQLLVANMKNQYSETFANKEFINESIKVGDTNGMMKQLMENTQKRFKTHPELQKAWQEAEQELIAQIVEANKSNVFLGSKDDKKYREELAKIYTINGTNLFKYYKDVEKAVPQTTPKAITDVENSAWYTRLSNKCEKTGQNIKAWFNSDEASDTKAIAIDGRYRGTPKYKTWSPDKRVSPVQYTQIVDYSKPFLKMQQERLKMNDQLAQSKLNASKMNSAVNKRKPDVVSGKKAPTQQKSAAQKKKVAQQEDTWEFIKSKWNNLFGR